jgi:hypothetical protein
MKGAVRGEFRAHRARHGEAEPATTKAIKTAEAVGLRGTRRTARAPASGRPRFHVVAAEESIGAADLEVATRLFGRWVARAFARNPEAFGPAPGRASGPGREDADGTAPARHVGRTGRTERTHST